MKKPSYPSKGALLLKKRRAGTTRNGNKAPGGRETRTDPLGETEKTENDPQKGEETSKTAKDHLSLSSSSGIHLSSSPPLTASVSQVLHKVQHEIFLRWPSQMKSDPTKKTIPNTVSSTRIMDTEPMTATN